MKRLPAKDLTGSRVELTGDELHYVRDVLRMTPGTQVEFFDGAGQVAVGTLLELQSSSAVFQLGDVLQEPEPPCEIHLFVAPPKGDRWTSVLEKATELGVAAIHPITTSRTVVKFKADRIPRQVDRWRTIITGAARQSGRSRTPVIHAPVKIDTLDWSRFEVVVVAHPEGTGELGGAATSVAVCVGPEGGFTEEEVSKLLTAGAKSISLGPRILRVETAVCALLVRCQAQWGDM